MSLRVRELLGVAYAPYDLVYDLRLCCCGWVLGYSTSLNLTAPGAMDPENLEHRGNRRTSRIRELLTA